jgi:Kef-type K+ transport system membrane component KefB
MSVLHRMLLIVAMGGLMQAVHAVDGTDDLRHRGAAVVLGLGFVLITSLFVGKLFAKLGLPKLTGYLATGIVTGPALLSYLDTSMVDGLKLANGMAVGLIALTGGSEMAFRTMRPLMRSIAWISAIAVCGTAALLGGVTFALRGFLPFMADLSPSAQVAVSACIGVVVVAQSPAVVVAVRSETGADGPVARTVLGVVVLADLVVIALFAVTSSMATAFTTGELDWGATARGVSWELFGSLAVGLAVGGLLGAYMRVVQKNLDLFVLLVCLISAEVGQRLHLDPLIVMLAAGMFVENVMHAGAALRRSFEAASLPVYILFFTVAGASIHLSAIATVWLPVLALIGARTIGLFFGTRVAAGIAGAPDSVRRWAGFGLLPQAGLAIALAMLFARAFPSFGEHAKALTLSIVAINELIAPALLRIAFVRSGEAKERSSVTDSLAGVPIPSEH